MLYARLGNSGLRVSRIALGMMSYGDPATDSWVLPEERAEPIVRRAVEAGVTFFDTADMYSNGVSEEVTGRLLAKFFARRDDYVLATKVFYPMTPDPNGRGLSRKHIMDAVDASLARLGTDHIDLYQIHRWDDFTPIEETMSALHDVVRAGKVRYLGASLMRAWQFATAQFVAPTRFVSMQTRYNLVYREEEREMIPFCADRGVGVLPYSPLARGVLAARPPGTVTPRLLAEPRTPAGNDVDVLNALRVVAEARGVPAAQVALAWTMRKPAVVAPVVGATTLGQVDDAVASVELALTDQELTALEAPYRSHELLPY
ncbi:aryl-alcohol dehydrogenase-like predicted oxidoreductase [Asanoa ferruginea]|uniref:Aryl-alcohol dehydrogenase-like predicted oxidoreductase n=1 Tax=Asanoa ferruginea TaxID=53367 RepID=A0A3D9ZEA5_9ACTN|nr:aldo/keto reductase [Asanoa ferruginea]REF94173.1 aryl-alcohol dehydrogenase-like predicted oxidoreductase [Asanoa ferruginea]GIF49882.1 oxidoreductase [Asanoa ferruginea]